MHIQDIFVKEMLELFKNDTTFINIQIEIFQPRGDFCELLSY